MYMWHIYIRLFLLLVPVAVVAECVALLLGLSVLQI